MTSLEVGYEEQDIRLFEDLNVIETATKRKRKHQQAFNGDHTDVSEKKKKRRKHTDNQELTDSFVSVNEHPLSSQSSDSKKQKKKHHYISENEQLEDDNSLILVKSPHTYAKVNSKEKRKSRKHASVPVELGSCEIEPSDESDHFEKKRSKGHCEAQGDISDSDCLLNSECGKEHTINTAVDNDDTVANGDQTGATSASEQPKDSHTVVLNEQTAMEMLHGRNTLYAFRNQDEVEEAGLREFCKFGPWTEEENGQLRKNWEEVSKECPIKEKHYLLMRNLCPDAETRSAVRDFITSTNFYSRLAENIPRSTYYVYQRARKMFHPGHRLGTFTDDEVLQIKELHDEFGTSWQRIGQIMGRSGMSVRDKWRVVKEELVTHRPWSEDELNRLREGVDKFIGKDRYSLESFSALPWTHISTHVETRSWLQCRYKWLTDFNDGSKVKCTLYDKAQIINDLVASGVKTLKSVNWHQLWKAKYSHFPSPYCIKFYVSKMLYYYTPQRNELNFQECLKYIQEKVVPFMMRKNKKDLEQADRQYKMTL